MTLESAAAEVSARIGLMEQAAPGQYKYLVTAGPTIEDLDPIRFFSNRSTGLTGISLAESAVGMGHQVLLILGPTQAEPDTRVPVVHVRSAREMEAACVAALDWCDVVLMCAAVADYRPETVYEEKLHKTADELVIKLVRNPDILLTLRDHATDQVLVGFSLDTTVNIDVAREKMRRKGLDLIVANSKHSLGTIGTDAVIIDRNGNTTPAGGTKEQLAEILVSRTSQLARQVRKGRSASMRFHTRLEIQPEE